MVNPLTTALNCMDCPGSNCPVYGVIEIFVLLVPTCTTNALDVVDPGFGLTTVRLTAVPFCAEVELPVAFSWVAEIKVVGRAVVPNMTCAPLTKFVPLTVIVKLPTGMGEGETALTVGTGFSSVSALLPVIVVSVTLVAVIVSVFGEGTVAGALYRPVLLIVPDAALPPATPFTDHVTVWLNVPPLLEVCLLYTSPSPRD